MTDKFTPIDDMTCERILARGKYIYDCRAECEKKVERDSTGMPTMIYGTPVNEHWRKHETVLKHIQVSIKCDRCNTKDIESSFNWNGYDLCLPCAGDFRRRTAEENKKTKDMVKRELSDYRALSYEPSRRRDIEQLVQMIFGITRNILPESFWNIPNTETDIYPADINLKARFDDFIRGTAIRFIDKFGTDHLAKCFDMDIRNDPIYGGDKSPDEDQKASEGATIPEPRGPNSSDWGDWGTTNSALDTSQ